MINLWNAWHGCHKISAGCQNCYMFRRDGIKGTELNIAILVTLKYQRDGVNYCDKRDTVLIAIIEPRFFGIKNQRLPKKSLS